MFRYKLFLALLVLIVSASPALAEINFSIEEPAADSTKSGIGQISGWAVSDVEIVTVEALIDGVSLGLVPYGGTRLDVATSFPDFPNSEFSGWAMKWNFSLLVPGEHTVTIIITDMDGLVVSKDVDFSTISFKTPFIFDSRLVKTADADVSSPEDGIILIIGADIDGEIADIELKWDRASQQFLISNIVSEDAEPENQPPQADAGPGFSVEMGETVVIEGEANDPDGNVVSYAWSQVSGLPVDLVNANQSTVEFVAPEQTGSVRLRLEVVDDGGAHDQDDAVIDIVEEPVKNVAPKADAGPDLTLETNEVIEIVGEGTDTDGTIVSWYWEQLSGVPLSLANMETQTVQITAPADAGEARMRLTVTDDDGATGDDEFDITIEATNNPPSANAGTDIAIETGQAVDIDGSATDSDGSITVWQWQQVSGEVVNLQNATTNQVSFTAPDSAGTIVLQLTVTDDDGASDDDQITITVNEPAPPSNQAPDADAGPDKTVDQGDNVTVTGSGSDPDGSIVAWSWSQVSGPSVNLSGDDGPDVEFTAPNSAGTIVLRLTVTDDDGASDDDEVTVTVNEPAPPDNQSPSANAGSNKTVNQGDNVTVTGSGSDPDGSIVAWSWSQVSGPSVNLSGDDGPDVEFTAPNSAGTIVLRLTVTDDDGASDDDEVTVTVNEPAPPDNQSPSANAGSNKTVNQGDNVTVTGSGSDPDGSIVDWSWSQVSGQVVNLQNATTNQVSFTAPNSAGTIVLQLTVTDDDDASDDDQITITVNEPAPPSNQAPNANAGSNKTVDQGDNVTVTGSGSDPDGSIVAWSWSQVSGQIVTLQNATTNQVRFTAPNSAGTIVLRLTVTDDDGASDDDQITITVNEPAPPSNQAPNANAGSNKTVDQGDNVTVTGSGSDPDGAIVEWAWSQVSGPSVNLSGDDGPEVEFTAPATNGDIRLRLTVTDDDGADDSDDVIITVESEGGDDDTTGETLQSMLDTINATRGQAQLCNGTSYPAQPPFTWSSSLANVAMEHSMDMASKGYFSHTSADGTTMGNRVFPHWSGNRVGENIATSSIDQSNSYIVQLWMSSTSGHCEIIMDPNYTHVGAGAGHNENNGYQYHHFWTLDFGG